MIHVLFSIATSRTTHSRVHVAREGPSKILHLMLLWLDTALTTYQTFKSSWIRSDKVHFTSAVRLFYCLSICYMLYLLSSTRWLSLISPLKQPLRSTAKNWYSCHLRNFSLLSKRLQLIDQDSSLTLHRNPKKLSVKFPFIQDFIILFSIDRLSTIIWQVTTSTVS